MLAATCRPGLLLALSLICLGPPRGRGSAVGEGVQPARRGLVRHRDRWAARPPRDEVAVVRHPAADRRPDCRGADYNSDTRRPRQFEVLVNGRRVGVEELPTSSALAVLRCRVRRARRARTRQRNDHRAAAGARRQRGRVCVRRPYHPRDDGALSSTAVFGVSFQVQFLVSVLVFSFGFQSSFCFQF